MDGSFTAVSFWEEEPKFALEYEASSLVDNFTNVAQLGEATRNGVMELLWSHEDLSIALRKCPTEDIYMFSPTSKA